MRTHVVVYQKPGCHLCHEALDLLDEVAAQRPLDVERRNILERAEWFEAFRYRIPVLVLDGVPRLEGRFNLAQLEALFESPQQGAPTP